MGSWIIFWVIWVIFGIMALCVIDVGRKKGRME